jgi:GGDEF domain-containing protein
MERLELQSVEFLNDGISDSLTQTMAPGLFHDNLKREIARTIRESQELTILSVTVSPQNFETVSRYEKALIEIGHDLRSQLRGGEFFSRISDDGFWILLRSNEGEAEKVMKRLQVSYSDQLTHFIVARKHDDYAAWIQRIDTLHFHSS